jgi:hypothetical protein
VTIGCATWNAYGRPPYGIGGGIGWIGSRRFDYRLDGPPVKFGTQWDALRTPYCYPYCDWATYAPIPYGVWAPSNLIKRKFYG